MVRRYDLVVIGGGTAGLVAAFGAAGVGARVLLAEAERTGGDCLWTGCVPSKTLLAAARRAYDLRTADRVGLGAVEPVVDLGRIMDRVHAVIAAIEPHDSPERLRSAGVEVVSGRARFESPGRIDIDGRRVAYRTALIATGSRPDVPRIDGLADVDPLTTDTVWGLRRLPERFVVLGGGAVGVELGQAFARLGSSVTIVAMEDRLLPSADPEAGALLERVLQAEGVVVRTAARAASVRDGVLVVDGSDGPDDIGFDRLLVATGRRPVTEGLGLDRVDVATDADGHVVVDDALRTTGRNIFAGGDVTGVLPFTHVAAAHGGAVVTNALFRLRRRPGHATIPWAVFTHPEVAHVGQTEAEARRERSDDVVVRRFDYGAVDRAVTAAETHGFAKLVGDGSGRLLGATVVGEAAGESIAELALWLRNRGRLRDVGVAIHAYPTFSEGPSRAGLEQLRATWFTPATRRRLRPVLWALRHLDRP